VSWQRPSDSRVYILLLLMAIFWSLNFVIAKVALREFPPLLLACLRTTISGVFILPISLWRERSAWREWKWTELRGILFLSIFGVVVNQVLFTIGLAWTSVAHASIVVTLMPVMVLIFSAIARQ
jgi:drug/metabolite transporter (DMT)-like permease